VIDALRVDLYRDMRGELTVTLEFDHDYETEDYTGILVSDQLSLDLARWLRDRLTALLEQANEPPHP
jgi:hypothetical protein